MSIKISELPEASTVGSTDMVPIVQNGETKKTPARNIKPDIFTGTDGVTAGTSGLVPAPQSTDRDRYLKSDGTWGEVTSTGESIIEIEDTSVRIWDLGDGIYHLPDNCEIYYKGATNTSVITIYTPVYLTVTVNTESDETNTRRDWYYVYQSMNEPYIRYGSTTASNGTEYNKKLITYTKNEIDTLLNAKQNALTAGSNISIAENVIATIGDTIPQLNDEFINIYQLEPGAYHLKRDGSIRVRYMAGRDFTVTGDAWLFVTTNQTTAPLTWLLIEAATTRPQITVGYSDKSGGDGSYKRTDPYHMESDLNKVTSLSSSSTNDQYTGAKLVYDELVQRDEAIAELEAENEQLLEQIPTATAEGKSINVQDSCNLPLADFAMLGNATQDGTPTPDTPQDIHVVTGDNTLTINGKNIYNATKEETTVRTVTVSADTQYIYLNGHVTSNDGVFFGQLHVPKGKYRLMIELVSGTIETTSTAWNKGLLTYLAADGSNGDSIRIYDTHTRESIVRSVSNVLQIYMFFRGTETFTNAKIAYQIIPVDDSGGTADYNFEPYIEPQTQLLSLENIELAKIGTYQDRIYKSGDKWYVEKNINKISLARTYTFNSTTSGNLFRTGLSTAKQVVQKVLCNMYRGIESSTGRTNYDIYYNLSTRSIDIIDNRYDNATDFNNYMANAGGYVLFALETPTTTEITDTTLLAQLENVLKMHTNKNVTNAWIEPTGTNAQGGLILTYRQDLNTLVDKITNLEARVSLLE